MGVKEIITDLKYIANVLEVLNIKTKTIIILTEENNKLQSELIELRAVIERWLKLGIEQNEQQTVFWDDDIVNLLKYIRGEKIE